MSEPQEAIAVVGMAGLFPGARGVEELWANLRAGVESITFFSAGGREAWRPPDEPFFRIPAKGVIEGVETWDADFFGVSRPEAELMDPQQRLFLECAWTALEHAGYDAQQYPGKIGVFGGISKRDYILLLARTGFMADPATGLFVQIGNEPDMLTTRTAYKLGLEGPSFNVQAGCASALVAVQLACGSLLAGECDMALAGGASISAEQRTGMVYYQGSFLSPLGRCRSFDEKADGVVDSDAVGIVVLKRLSKALAEGDHIHAVIRGWSTGNDGAERPGLLVPAQAGRARVIREALERAGTPPDTVTYVEAHGNGSRNNDAMEVAALTQAFRGDGDRPGRRGYCAIGSVKTNVGHANGAAGITSLIKTVLALEHRELPASLNYEKPNPEIDFASSPFFVNTRLRSWETNGAPRRALVNAFGVGGLNAHMVLEEAPPQNVPASAGRPWQILTLSARTPAALESMTEALAAHLERHIADIADIAWTLQTGRRAFEHRRTVLCRNAEEAVRALRTLDPASVATGAVRRQNPPVAFLLPAESPEPAILDAGPYAEEELFRAEAERCASVLRPHLGRRLRDVLLKGSGEPLDDPELADLALFTLQYALGRLWTAWGLKPGAIAGEGVGEYAAACLDGRAPLEDTLALLAAQGVQPGHFAAAPGKPADAPDRLVLEIGLPGATVAGRLRDSAAAVLSALPPSGSAPSGAPYPLEVLARAWREGAKIDWRAHRAGEERRRLALPTYPYERQRYWVDPTAIEDPFMERLAALSSSAAFDE